MDDNKRPVHSVDDYYPKPSSRFEETSENTDDSFSETVDTDHTEHNDFQEDSSSHSESSYTYKEEHRSDTHMMRCPHCGNETPSNMNFCSLCGYHFQKEQDTPYPLNNTRIDGYLTDDIASFVGVNYVPYLKKFQKVSEGRISFNWAAAIFSNRWLAYRGMFRTAFLFSVGINIFSAVISYIVLSIYYSAGTTISESSYMQINTFSMILSIAIGLITGVLGDSLYWKHTKKNLDALQCQGREPWSDRKIAQRLRARGGCKFSYVMLIICFDLSCNELITSFLEKLLSI